MPDIIITPSTGKLEFIDNSAQTTRRHSFTLDHSDGLVLDAPLSAAAISAPLNVINVTVNNSNANYPFVLAQSGETGAKNLLMDGAGGTYNPFTNTATIDISGNSATTTLASNSTNLGGVAAASYVTLTGTQTLTNKTITGTFTGNLTGTGSWATNAVSAVSATTATNSTQLNGQAASYYTNIPARLGYTPVNQAGDTISGNLTVNGNFAVNGSVTAFSASNIYITSSNLTVTDNILLMNALSPYQRYAGIQMYDSGSGTLSQFLWDGEGDYFFLTGSSVNGKIITGPDGQTNLTSGYIPKATAGYKLGNSLIYDNGTNIGIGTTNPSYKLEVYSGAKTSAFTGLSISNFNNYDGTAASLVTSQLRFAILENDTGTYNAPARTFAILESGNEVNNSSSDGFFAISTRRSAVVSEKFRITSTGNTIISGSLVTTSSISAYSTITATNTLYIQKGVGGYLSYITAEQTAASTGNAFKFWNSGGNTLLTITYDGNFGIGTTSTAQKLDVVGNIRCVPVSSAWAEGLSFSMPTTSSWGGLRWRRERANADGNHYIGYIGTDTTDDLVFGSNNAGTQIDNNIRITKAGLVGVGTSSPSTKFHVVGVISGSSFSGAGTGLTGTAASLTAGTATNATQLGGVAAASYVTLNDTQSLTNKTITGTFTGALTGNASTATALTSMNISQFTNNSLYQYHRGDITSLSSSATNVVQPLGTFDGSNITNAPTSGWYNYLSSTHGSYLTSLIANLHRSSDWYVGYKEGPGGTPTNPSWFKLLHSGNYSSYTNLTASWATNAVTALNVGNGTITIAAGTGVGVGTTNTFTTNQSGATTVTVTNTGVTSNVAGSGISVSGATGAVTITNSGVTSAVAGTGVGVSAATGAVTFSIGQAVGTTNSPTFAAITTTTDGANITMAGTTNAEGIRMTPANSTTYPVFLRSVNPGVGEASPWIYKEQATDWGIWHNNPVNSIDFTKQGSGGIASNVGGSSTNTVTVRVEMATGFVQTIAGYRNSAGTTILSDAGNITGNAATVTNGIYTTSIIYVGTTAITMSRSPASQTLSGISIDGNAATVTNGLYTTGGQTIAGITYFSNGESMNVYGIRGRFTNEYLHLYNKVGVGHPGGWGQGEGSTPTQGLSTYGGLTVAYGTNATSIFYGNVGIGTTVVNARVESYYSSNAITFNYLATNLNGNSPIPVYGFDVTSGAEARSIKAGIGYERHLTNGRGTMHFYNDSTNDTASLTGSRSNAIDIKMSLDNSGNLGIGTTTPAYKLHVVGDIYANGGSFRISGNNGYYFESYGGGWYMSDSTWIRSISDKNVWVGTGLLGAQGGLTVGYGGASPTSLGAIISGSVGIGTSSPSALLNIRSSAPTGTGTVTTGTNLLIDSNTNNYITFRNTADNGTYAGLVFLDNNIGGYITFGNAGAAVGSDSMIYGAYQDHIFQNGYVNETLYNRTETMRIKQNGNVGIGSNNPQYKLDVQGTFNATGTATLAGVSITGTINSSATEAVRINNNSGYISFYNTAGSTRTGYLQGLTGGSLTLSAENGALLQFLVNGTERLRIDTSGNVGIGTTSAGRKLDVEGVVRTRGASGTGGFEISAATTGTAKWRIEWDSASDSLDFNWVG